MSVCVCVCGGGACAEVCVCVGGVCLFSFVCGWGVSVLFLPFFFIECVLHDVAE